MELKKRTSQVNIQLLIAVIGTAIVIGGIAGTIGYNKGYNKAIKNVPNSTVTTRAAYRSFNYSMQSIQQNNWQQAKKHIRSGDSFLSILYQTGHKKYGRIWFRNEITCFKKNNQTACQKRVIGTMRQLINSTKH